MRFILFFFENKNDNNESSINGKLLNIQIIAEVICTANRCDGFT